jgi:hypothetical protein
MIGPMGRYWALPCPAVAMISWLGTAPPGCCLPSRAAAQCGCAVKISRTWWMSLHHSRLRRRSSLPLSSERRQLHSLPQLRPQYQLEHPQLPGRRSLAPSSIGTSMARSSRPTPVSHIRTGGMLTRCVCIPNAASSGPHTRQWPARLFIILKTSTLVRSRSRVRYCPLSLVKASASRQIILLSADHLMRSAIETSRYVTIRITRRGLGSSVLPKPSRYLGYP